MTLPFELNWRYCGLRVAYPLGCTHIFDQKLPFQDDYRTAGTQQMRSFVTPRFSGGAWAPFAEPWTWNRSSSGKITYNHFCRNRNNSKKKGVEGVV